jgi:gluconate 2-dehydrogenase gamma chain
MAESENELRDVNAKREPTACEERFSNQEGRGGMRRRDWLKAMTAVPAAALVPGPATRSNEPAAARRAEGSQPASGTYQRKVLDEHEWKTIRMLSDLIIPADERSGSATQAGVPEFIDDWLDFQGGTLLAEIRGGLTWLDMECNRHFNHDFADCSEAQQKQILDRIAYPKKAAPEDANAVAFFNRLRGLVVSGFFSSKMGVEDLPYLGNTMVAEWHGCPPEVLTKLGLKGDPTK